MNENICFYAFVVGIISVLGSCSSFENITAVSPAENYSQVTERNTTSALSSTTETVKDDKFTSVTPPSSQTVRQMNVTTRKYEPKIEESTVLGIGKDANSSIRSVSGETIVGNISTVTLVREEPEFDFGLRKTAGFVAVGFLIFAVFGYAGFVLWRRYLQNKYGNGQTLITDDAYDISDLRYFEI